MLKGEWLYTGDMAEVDPEGFIYLVDRKKDVIISGGENLYPVQIEDFLRKFDKVKDVAVIGLPDHRLGEIAPPLWNSRRGSPAQRRRCGPSVRSCPGTSGPAGSFSTRCPATPPAKSRAGAAGAVLPGQVGGGPDYAVNVKNWMKHIDFIVRK